MRQISKQKTFLEFDVTNRTATGMTERKIEGKIDGQKSICITQIRWTNEVSFIKGFGIMRTDVKDFERDGAFIDCSQLER